jgi:hypothetical protein
MDLTELSIDEAELGYVVDAALERVTPSYAAARYAGCVVTRLDTPAGTSRTVVILRITSTSPRAARGQYLPLTDMYDRGYVDEYLFGMIHGHWLATHQRDLFHEVAFVVDAGDVEDSLPLYDYISVAAARTDGLIPSGSPLADAIETYNLRWVLRAGDVVSGPSPGMVATVGREVARSYMPRVLDLFAGTCCLSRVALEHGAASVTCLDTNLNTQVANDNLGAFASRASLLDVSLAAGLPDEKFDLVTIDPFYDHTLQAINEALDSLGDRFTLAVINLGLDLPSAWQKKIMRKITSQLVIVTMEPLFGERVAVCKRRD